MITHEGVVGESEANVRNKYPAATSTSNLPAPWGKTQLSKQHDDVRIMTHRFHVPVFIGEFSCINWAPMNDNGKWSSTEWINDNITLLEAEGWSWAYHTWRGDYVGWEAEIPSSYYKQFSFSNATPQGLPSYSTWIKARSDTAPTIVMLKKWFKLNAQTSQGTPSINIGNDTVYEAQGTAPVNIQLSGASTKPVSVILTTANGTAIRAQDYRGKRDTLTIPAGSTSITVDLKIIKDNIAEVTEYFYVKLKDPVNATLAETKAMVVILDGAPPKKLSGSGLTLNSSTKPATDQKIVVKAQPNPSASYFTLITQSASDQPISVRIIDMSGRVIEAIAKALSNSVLRIGDSYKPGIYFAEVIQGNDRTVLKLDKQ